MKKELVNMFKKLSKVYDDGYVVKGIARNHEAFKLPTKRGESLYKTLENMDAKKYDNLTAIIRTFFMEDNKDARPFIKKGNFAIKFDDIVKILVKIFQKQ